MNQIYFEFPFLHINNYQIMPSLIVFFIFLVILVLLFFGGKLGKIKSNPDINNPSVKQRYRYILKNTFLFGTAYIMIFLMSYFFKDEKDLGDKANIIVKLANAYLKIELLAVLIMFFAFMYIFLVNKNKKAYFEFLKNPIVILVYLSAFSYAVTHRIELGYKYNVFGYMFLAVFSIMIFLVDITDKVIENEQAEKRNPYNPIKNYDDLCKSHQRKAESLKRIIERNSNLGGISILVKGDWGIGKTSVVNGAIQKLKEDSTYEVLRINALEIDSLESLFNYFFDFIRRCLKERGAYTGIASEYREFVSSALGIVTTESFGNIFTRFFYSENKGYRDKKDELEKSIGNVLGRDKIIIVVDDIERCEKEKVKQFIFFIKEIATMNNCITIFVSDEKALKKCIDIEMNDFLDKFFNYTVSVNATDYTQVLDSLSKTDTYENYIHCYSTISKNLCYMRFKKINNNLESNELGFLTLEEVIRSIIESLDRNLNKYEAKIKSNTAEETDENKAGKIKSARSQFISDVKNPRKLIKMYKLYDIYISKVNEKLILVDNDRNLYFNQINISETIFILSYIEVNFPEQFYNIEKNKIDNYLETLNEEKISGKSEIILEIADGYWFERNIYSEFSVDFNSKYLYKKTITFLKELMGEDKINGNLFTSQEDEWVLSLPKSKEEKQDNNNWKEIEQNWLKVLEVLILKRSYDMNDIRKKEKIEEYEYKIKFLLNQVYEKIENKKDLLKIFSEYEIRERIFKNEGIIDLIQKNVCKEDIEPSFFENIFDEKSYSHIKYVFLENAFMSFKIIGYLNDNESLILKYRLKEFLNNPISIAKLDAKVDLINQEERRDILSNTCKTFKMKLLILIKEVFLDFSKYIDFIKFEILDDICIFNEFDKLFIFVEEYMHKNGWDSDKIFKRELEKAKLSVLDLKAFIEIVKFYSRESVDFSKENVLREIDVDKINIYNIISFITNLKKSENKLNLEQKYKLDLIVDEYEEYSKDIECNKYRRILLEHTEK